MLADALDSLERSMLQFEGFKVAEIFTREEETGSSNFAEETVVEHIGNILGFPDNRVKRGDLTS